MARLLDCFLPLASFGLALDTSIAADAPVLACDAAQRQARALLDRGRADAGAAGASPTQIESAAFAMVAWIDEILARHPDGCNGQAAPLQMQLFNSNNARSEFFHHLAALAAEDDAVREVYWHALAYGFKGQYHFEDGSQGELGKLKELHGRQLQCPPLALGDLAREHITPQPYAAPDPRDPRGPRDPRRRGRALLRTAAVLALLLPLLYLLRLWFVGSAESGPTLARRVEQQLQTYACADLTAKVDNQTGRTQVSGFVSQPGDLAKIERDVAALEGVTSPRFDLQLRVWPYCEVVAILKPYQAHNREKAYGLQVAVPSARGNRLREGDVVRVQIAAPHHDSHLWVDYYTADGSVLHLNAGQSRTRLGAGQTLELGRDIPASWLVSPPFGSVLITALSSPMPFNETADRPPFELASAYLLRLREALAANKGGDRLIADFVFLQTVSR
jgi:type IV/VI secretion system ImpK/VasF family protein